MKCIICHADSEPGVKFCDNCGSNMKRTPSSTPDHSPKSRARHRSRSSLSRSRQGSGSEIRRRMSDRNRSQILCPNCHASHKFGDEQCRLCGADLHTASLQRATSVSITKKKRGDSSEKRENIVDEIISSEQVYMTNLEIISEKIIPMFREKINEKHDFGITEEKISQIFMNIPALAEFHKTFYKNLQTRDIGNVFIKFSDFFKSYTAYVNGFDAADDCLEQMIAKEAGLKKFIRCIGQIHSHSFASFLILPIQRVPRYLLLLRDLKKHTPETHPDYEDIELGRERISEIATFINEEKRRLEQMNKLTEIQSHFKGDFQLISPHRVFIREGHLVLLKRSFFGTRVHKFLLFNDILLWTALKGTYKGVRHLNNLDVEDVPPSIKKNAFQLEQFMKETVKLQAQTENGKREWMEVITDCRDRLREVQVSRIMAMKDFPGLTQLRSKLEAEIGEFDEYEGKGGLLVDLVAPNINNYNGDSEDEGPDKDESEENWADFLQEIGAVTPLADMRKLVSDALIEDAIYHSESACSQFEESDAKITDVSDVLSPLASGLLKAKTILEKTKTRNIAPGEVDETELAVERASETIQDISLKIANSMTKFDKLTVKKRHRRSSIRMETLKRRFSMDDERLEDALASLALSARSIDDVLCDTGDAAANINDPRAKEFWIKHFGSKESIVDFQDIKINYEQEFADSLHASGMSQEFADALLDQFGLVSPWKERKLFPVSVKSFGTITDGLGFPFDLTRASGSEQEQGSSLLEKAQARETSNIVTVGTNSFIENYFTTGTNFKMLKRTLPNGENVLHTAAKRGDLDIYKSLEEVMSSRARGMPKSDTVCDRGLLPLHHAVFGNHDELIHYLNRTTKTKDEVLKARPLLHTAVKLNHPKCVKRLVKNFKNLGEINQTDADGKTALQIATTASNHKMVKILSDRGAVARRGDVKRSIHSDNALVVKLVFSISEDDIEEILRGGQEEPLLHHAACHGVAAVCNVLLAHGASLDDREEQTGFGDTAFLAAVKAGNKGTAGHFTKVDPDVVKQTDNEGRSALHLSCYEGDSEMAGHLLDSGCDINQPDNEGRTPAMIAAELSEVEVMNMFLDHEQTDLNIVNKQKETVFAVAAKNHNLDLCKKLSEKGADPNYPPSKPPILGLAKSGNEDAIRCILACDADANIKSSKTQRTALHQAAKKSNVSILRMLIAAGADLTSLDKDGNTALHVSISIGDHEAARIQIECGTPLDIQNSQGNTVLQQSIVGENNDITKLLLSQEHEKLGLEKHNKLGHAAIHTAINSNNDSIHDLLEIGGQANLTAKNHKRSSPLIMAAEKQSRFVKAILENGGDVDYQDAKGRTPLRCTAGKGDIQTSKTLIQHDADVSIQDNKGISPFITVADSGYHELLELLLKLAMEKGIMDDTTNDGRTALYTAAYSGHTEIIERLLQSGADITIASKKGWTPLHASAYKKHPSSVSALLNAKADPNSANFEGITPLCNAAQSGNLEIAGSLLAAGAVIDPNKRLWTPLQLSVLHNRQEMSLFLLENGADCTCENQNRQSAVLYMISRPVYDKEYKHPLVEAMWTLHPEVVTGYGRLKGWLAALGRVHLMRYYIELGGAVTQRELKTAAEYNQEQMVDFLSQHFKWSRPSPNPVNGSVSPKRIGVTAKPEKPPKPPLSRTVTKFVVPGDVPHGL